ncbi:MAG: UDP-N-acetylglucosamine 2-epimerase (hydrolyzing) [Nanoarchaeota archaeon]|nr:UDP-N-acetylglucosamine 2-epimerase (hydrolyzing) [Nanoarchaeota archaeon]
MRRVCVVITSRAQYGRLKPLLISIRDDAELELQVIVSGSAASEKEKIIIDDLAKESIIPSFISPAVVEGGNPLSMTKTTGLALLEYALMFDKLRPDIVVVRGDRYEIMAPVLSSVYLNIFVAHIEGGDVSGTVDETIRHSITKLSNLHFPTNNDSYKRVLSLGESKDLVFDVGSLDVEFIKLNNEKITMKPFHLFEKNKDYSGSKGIGPRIDLNNPYLVVQFHPVTFEYDSMEKQTLELLSALKEINMQTIIFWPNTDSGSDKIEMVYRKFIDRELNDHKIHFYRNLHPLDFLSLINGSSCFIGNSSSMIKEGSYLGIPCVNIGSRQEGRLKSDNVLSTPVNSKDIIDAIKKQLNHGVYVSSHLYGDGETSKKIVSVLKLVKLSTVKKISY